MGAKEPNSLVDYYTGGHGMSFGLEDQKPQPQAPQPHCWGFSFGRLSGRPLSLLSQPRCPILALASLAVMQQFGRYRRRSGHGADTLNRSLLTHHDTLPPDF